MSRDTTAARHWSYEVSASRVRRLRLMGLLPGHVRARIAERFLRRPGQPGPAAEHVLQYLVSDILRGRGKGGKVEPRGARSGVAASESNARAVTVGQADGEYGARSRVAASESNARAVTVGQADFFYKSQYRQFCSPVMGAFAATAHQVLAASGTAPSGHLWWRRRRSVSAMIPADTGDDFCPILVIDEGTLALAVLVPRSADGADEQQTSDWVQRGGPMPRYLAALVAGAPVASEAGVAHARQRSHSGSVCELVDAALRSGFLALLALHPYDPDAMGLHLTMFGVEGVEPDRLVQDYGLDPADLATHRAAAAAQNATLYYLVGGTAEVFTQCSQNLFTKQARPERTHREDGSGGTDAPRPPLDLLLAQQFETLQATVAADGVPGASPRNGQIGRAAYLGSHRGRAHILIPYHPGNAIHGHAAKLWSNRHGSIVVADDHSSLRRVTIAGASGVLSHRKVQQRFPSIARAVTNPEGDDVQTVGDPVYWFVTRADEVVWEAGLLTENELTAERPACGINAGGEGRHTKKPKYFDATAVGAYDMHLQHRREASPRNVDPTGATRAAWLAAVAPALDARKDHLATTSAS